LYRAALCFPLICHPKHKGFIDQFATVTNAKGVRVLDANYVGLWSAMNYVSQAVSQFGSPLTAQKFGIRFNLYLFTLLKLVVSWRSRACWGRAISNLNQTRTVLNLFRLHTQTIITEIFSTTWWHFLLAKLFNGFAAGLIGTSVMSYASEIAMSQFRGTVLSSYAFFFALGQLASAIGLDIINRVSRSDPIYDQYRAGETMLTRRTPYYLFAQKTPMAFRTAFYSQFVFLGLWLPILVFLPESPVWLYKKGKHDKAQRARRRLIGNVPGYDWDHEYAVFAQDIDHSMQVAAQASRYTMLATLKGTNLRRTLMSTMPLCIQVSGSAPFVDRTARRANKADQRNPASIVACESLYIYRTLSVYLSCSTSSTSSRLSGSTTRSPPTSSSTRSSSAVSWPRST
jgi:MFS family permease